jgi:hypothetical protein
MSVSNIGIMYVISVFTTEHPKYYLEIYPQSSVSDEAYFFCVLSYKKDVDKEICLFCRQTNDHILKCVSSAVNTKYHFYRGVGRKLEEAINYVSSTSHFSWEIDLKNFLKVDRRIVKYHYRPGMNTKSHMLKALSSAWCLSMW